MFKYSTISGPVAVAGLTLMLALGACSSGSDGPPATDMTDATDTDTDTMPDPGPSDLDETQMAAADAAAAAKTAADGAEAAAAGAETATANIATLQTGGMAAMAAMDARKYADMAMAAYMDAKAASDAAAAAATGPAAENAWRDAVNAQDAAEDAAKMAGEKAMAATDAAKMELHIDGTMKMVGDSSIDADMGMLTKTDDAGNTAITGMQAKMYQPVRTGVGKVEGKAFAVKGLGSDGSTTDPAAKDQAYVQAVQARDVTIGKTLDTTDDKARLTLVTGYVGSQMHRVFTDSATVAPDDFYAVAGGKVTIGEDEVTLKSVGMFIEATGGNLGEIADVTDVAGGLDFSDRVNAKTGADDDAPVNKPVEVFSYVADEGGTNEATKYVVEVSRRVVGGVTTGLRLQEVDIDAIGAPDDPRDGDIAFQPVRVTAAVPAAVKYSHIHFGVWAGLGAAKKSGSQTIADLGIGFVQNVGEGMTEKQGIGMATFNGDWVAAVRRQYASDADAGAIKIDDGMATLTADFGKDTMKAALDGLATLEGSLSGNGFSGTTAKAIMHDDLNKAGTFAGSFSGGIYGLKGDEAAGVFDFSGGEAGAFRGAFGGKRKQ